MVLLVKEPSSHLFNLDLVVFVDGLMPDSMKDEFPSPLDAVQAGMDSQCPNTRDTEWCRIYGLGSHIKNMEIHILISAMNFQPRDFLDVSNPEKCLYMSASVGLLAMHFMKNQGPLFKDINFTIRIDIKPGGRTQLGFLVWTYYWYLSPLPVWV